MNLNFRAALYAAAIATVWGPALAGPNEGEGPVETGPAPAAVDALAAVVAIDGSLVRGHVGTTSQADPMFPGGYRVHFNRNIAGCVLSNTSRSLLTTSVLLCSNGRCSAAPASSSSATVSSLD